MSKDVLVTGGAGFVGSHLCERLVYLGHKVVSVDNYFTGSKNNHVDGVEYINDEAKNINDIFDGYVFDEVFHLGEYSRVEQSFEDVDTVLRYNTEGINAVLEYCRTYGSKLIYAGSSTKFGDNGPGSSPYAFTKSKNTELVINYGDWFGIDYAISYFYNVYGPREIEEGQYATVIAKFRKMKEQGLPLTVVLPGTQKRNFTHISDIVAGLIYVGEYGSGDGYAIGNSRAYSILEVAEMFNTEITLLPERRGNRNGATIDTSKVQALGWKETVHLEDYLKENL